MTATEGILISVEPTGDGFFYEPEPGFQTTVVDSNNFQHVPLAGLPELLQFFRLTTRGRGRVTEHLVVFALKLSHDAIATADRVIREAYPDTVVAFVLDARTGYARVTTLHSAGEQSPFALATSVAAMLATASWDESVPIVIVLGAKRFDVSLDFERTRGWTAQVRETSTEAG